VAYIGGAAKQLAGRYGVAPGRIFVMGHSNGAVMAQRLICQSDVFAAAVAVSGPLNVDTPRCPMAQGRRVLAIHGADDANVPVGGGVGRGLAQIRFRAEADSQRTMQASGAAYTLEIVPGADHPLDHIDAALGAGKSVADQAAAFFGLNAPAGALPSTGRRAPQAP
jgi:predicted esterase